MIRILIADDHEMIREGLRKVLAAQPDWVICGEAADGRAAVAQALQLQPDLMVLDFSMSECNGLEVTRQVLAALPRTEIMILTVHESAELAHELLAAGARGLIFKSDAGKELVKGLQHLLRHQPYCSGKLSGLIVKAAYLGHPRHHPRPCATLTPREREIVRLIGETHGSKQIAAALHISEKTVNTHRANLMRKLGVHSVSELVRYALRAHLVDS